MECSGLVLHALAALVEVEELAFAHVHDCRLDVLDVSFTEHHQEVLVEPEDAHLGHTHDKFAHLRGVSLKK